MSNQYAKVLVPRAVVAPRGAIWAAAIAVRVFNGLRWIVHSG